MNESDEGGPLGGLQTARRREALLLAPYAMHSCDSRGRVYPEAEHPYRGPYQRDRDRIVHSAAYRRLSGKMQVFTGDRGDYHRTRLTHTQEVASIARTIGRALRLNEDLIEALALLHDLGHPPYGHAGEDALDECLQAAGGFSHNRYGLTVVEVLEHRSPDYPGLNLTREVLDGQLWRGEKSAEPVQRLLEVRVVDAADSITYNAHDADDAVKLGLVTLEELAEVPLASDVCRALGKRLGTLHPEQARKLIVHDLIDCQVGDLLRHCSQQLADADLPDAETAGGSPLRIEVSPSLQVKKEQLEAFLYERVYRHPELLEMRAEAQARLHELFTQLCAQPDRLPIRFQKRAAEVGLARAVGDYVAGMTDRYCDQLHAQLCAGRRSRAMTRPA